MTKRQEAFYWCAIAYGFAYTGKEEGYKGYKRAEKLLLKVMDELKTGLTDKQIDKALKEAKKYVVNKGSMNAFDFMDCIVRAMEIIKQGKIKYLNSWLALAATNVEEEV